MSSAKPCAVLVLITLLAACSGPSKTAHHPSEQVIVNEQTVSMLHVPQIPAVELGKRPPNARMTKENMPFFDIVTYCELTTDTKEASKRGPLYESCADDQLNYRDVIGQAVDAEKFQSSKIIRCAKASRTAYQGEWFCLNGQEF